MTRLIKTANNKIMLKGNKLAGVNNLSPENIKSGVEILGVTGNYIGEPGGVEVHSNTDCSISSTASGYNDILTINNVIHTPKYICYSRNDVTGSYSKTIFGLNYPYPIDNSTGYVTYKTLDGVYNPPSNVTFTATYDNTAHTLTITIINASSSVAQFLNSSFQRCIIIY